MPSQRNGAWSPVASAANRVTGPSVSSPWATASGGPSDLPKSARECTCADPPKTTAQKVSASRAVPGRKRYGASAVVRSA